MKKKQVAFSVLTAALAASLTACSSDSPAETAGNSSAAASTPMSQPVSYKILRSLNIPDYPADGGRGKQELLKAMEKDGITGIDFNVTIPGAGSDYITKLNLLAASGDLPDYFNLDIPTMAKMADDGLILPLDDYIAKMPNAAKLIKQSDLEALRYNGKIYALPVSYRPESFNGPNTIGMALRSDWLANVGLKEPTTIDELYEVLKAFTFSDPDKNGKKDTYGFGATKDDFALGKGSYGNGIFGAFGVMPGFWHERDGKLMQGMVLPEMKEVIALISKWYKEGLIDPEFLLTDTKQMTEKIVNSKVGVFEMGAFDVNPTGNRLVSLKKFVPDANFTMLQPPTGPKGLKGYPEAAPGQADLKAVSAKIKNPDRLFQLLDWTAKNAEMVTYGVQGEHYTFDQAKNRIDLKVKTNSELYKIGFGNPIRLIQVVDRRWMEEPGLKALDILNTQFIENKFWKTVPAMLEYPDLKSMWAEYFSKIVIGEISIEKYDEFVKKYYQQGGQKIENQVNEEWKNTKK